MKSLGLVALMVVLLTGMRAWNARLKHPSIPLSNSIVYAGMVSAALLGAFFVLYGIIFLLAALGRLRRLRQESYALTDCRVLILNRASSKISSLAYDETTPCEAFRRNDGSGRVVFGKIERSRRIIEIGKKAITLVVFDDIDNAAFVCALARDAAGKRRQSDHGG